MKSKRRTLNRADVYLFINASNCRIADPIEPGLGERASTPSISPAAGVRGVAGGWGEGWEGREAANSKEQTLVV